jgi:hypothetical protein
MTAALIVLYVLGAALQYCASEAVPPRTSTPSNILVAAAWPLSALCCVVGIIYIVALDVVGRCRG